MFLGKVIHILTLWFALYFLSSNGYEWHVLPVNRLLFPEYLPRHISDQKNYEKIIICNFLCGNTFFLL